MLTKSKTTVRIPRRDWEKLKKNPSFGELIELLEDRADLEAAKKGRGKDMTPTHYLTKHGIRNNH